MIGGEREAALTYRAAVTSFPEVAAGPLVVIDIGGGSTEVIVAEGGVVRLRDSLPLGSVRLTEKFVHHDPALTSELAAVSAGIEPALGALPPRAAGGATYQLVGTAGTVTTLAAMAQDLASWDPARVHGYRLKRIDLDAQIDRLARSSQARARADGGPGPTPGGRHPGRGLHPGGVRAPPRRTVRAGERPRDPLGTAVRKARRTRVI